MKTKEEILKGRELQVEDFSGRDNHLTVFSKGNVLASIEEYVKQEAIVFAKFVQQNCMKGSNNTWVKDDNGYPITYTTEELYTLYLKTKK